MSRLAEIVENHHRLDELTGLFKHHGVNAEFVAETLVRCLAKDHGKADGEEDKDQAGGTEEAQGLSALLEDLRQFRARF